MDENEANWKIAALTAIIQTLILEHYWEEDEDKGKRRFLGMAEGDHPVAIAVMNELTEDELDAAFRWPDQTHMGTGKEIPAMPVVAYLTQDQYERARVTCVAEHEGDRSSELAMEESEPSWERNRCPGSSEQRMRPCGGAASCPGWSKDLHRPHRGEEIGRRARRGALRRGLPGCLSPGKAERRNGARTGPGGPHGDVLRIRGDANPHPEPVRESPHRADSGASFAGVVSRPRRYSSDELLHPSHGRW